MIQVLDSNGNIKMKVVSLGSTTIGSAINAIGAGTQTLTAGTLIFSNANGVTFGLNGSTLTASAAGGGGGAAVSFSAGTQSTTIGNLVFSNSNSVSFGLSNNTVTASFSAPAQSVQPVAISASNGSFAFSTVTFGNANGMSFLSSNGSIVGSYSVPTITNSSASISAGTQSTTLGNLVFSNSNGFSFGLSNNTITGSYTVPTQSNAAFSAGAASSTFQTLSFQDSNGVSFSNNAGAIRLTHDLQYTSNTSAITSNALNTSASRVINLVAATNNTGGGTASLSSNVSFSNANNISFYTSAGNAIVASFSQSVDTGKAGTGFTSAGANVSLSGTLNTNGLSLSASVAAQTNQTANFYVSGNTTQLSSTAGIDLRSVSFEGAGVASVGVSNGRVLISVPSGGGGGAAISANANSQSTGTVNFANSNGISFGLSNNGTMTASHNGITSQTNQNVSLYALGNTTQNSSTVLNASNLSFNAIGSLTVGYSNGSIQFSAPSALTSQSNQAFSAGAASSAFQTLSFQDSNGISFSNNAGAIRLTHDLQFTSATSAITSNALNTSASRVINLVAATNNTGGGTASLSSNVSFSNANNISFYTSAGNAIVASFSQSVDTGKAGTGFTSAGANVSLSGTLNTNGLSLSASVAAQSNQNISLYGLGNTTQNISTVLNASNLSFNAIGSLTVGYSNGSIQLSAPNALTSQSNQVMTLFATGNTTQNSSTTFNASSLLLNGAGAASVGFSNGSLVISAPSAAAGNVTISAGANSAGLASLVFSNSNGVSFGLNGSTITASAAAGGGGVNIAASNTTFTSGTVVLSNNGGALTISSGAQSVLFSVPATSSLSATGRVSISVNGSTISIGVPNPYVSSYQNLPAIVASSAMTWGGTSLSHAAAFQLPEQVSFSFMRIPALMTTNSTTIATLASATATASGALYSTINAVIYSLGSGASSKSLQYVTSGAGNYTFSQQISVSNSTQGSYSLGLTAEIEGIGARTNLTTQYSISNTNYSFTTNQFTDYTSARFLDIPFAASLSAGAYWAIIGMSSSSASGGAAGLAALTNCNVRYSAHYGVSQAVLSIAPMGAANKTIAYLGAGSFSTAGGGTTNSINITNLSSMASNAMMFFQMLRSA